MDILHYNKPINIEELVTLIDSRKKTLLIVPDKYRFFIYQNILEKNKIIFNLSLLSPNNFLKSVLSDNNILVDEASSLVNKIKINNNLSSNHSYQNNYNFISELFKLKQELFYSNIAYQGEYLDYIDYQYLDLDNLLLKVNYDLIIYCDEDFYPLHHQLLNSLATTSMQTIDDSLPSKKLYYEHSNTIKMLDYIIKDVYEQDYENLLIIVDDPIQQDYLINKFNELNIAFTNLNAINNLDYPKIKSLLAVIDHQANQYDYLNLKDYYLDFKHLETLINLDYHSYLKELYEILLSLQLFDLAYLNNLFTNLYLIKDSNITFLNKLLGQEFNNHLNKPVNSIAKIVLADSSFTSLSFDKVIVVDASLNNFNASSASYLLNTQQRLEISNELISNIYYLDELKLKQERLLNCGSQIMFHYSLLDLKNTSQDLKVFIKLNDKKETNSDEMVIVNKQDHYLHLTTKSKQNDSLLINNQSKPLDSNKLLLKLNNQIKLSATTLDSFHSCPYKFLVDRIYKPKIIKEYSYLTLGTIQHHVVEKINQAVIEANLTYATYPFEQLLTIIDQESDIAVYEDQDTNYDGVDKKAILNRVKANITNFIKSMIYYEQFTKFKLSESEKELRIAYPNKYFDNVSLVGKVDAIMTYENLAYVLDYKSSKTEFKESIFSKGGNNQLIVYLKLLEAYGYTPYGAFYKALNHTYIKQPAKLLSEFINNEDTLNKLHLEEHNYYGIAFEKYDPLLLDNQLVDGTSTILKLNPKSRKKIFLEQDKYQEYQQQLASNIEHLLEYLKKAHFKAEPSDVKKDCVYCDYKNICKFYFKNNENESNEEVDENE